MNVVLRNGREMAVPDHADIDIMLEYLAGGRELGEIAGEAVLFWAEVVPRDDDGALTRQLVEACRDIVERRR